MRKYFFLVRPLPVVRMCATKEELIAHVGEVHQGAADFVADILPDMLDARAYPEGWSPAKNVRHVANTSRLVARWLALPGWLIRLFGKPRRPQSSLAELNPTNRPPRYDYGKYAQPGKAREGEREKLIAELVAAGEKVQKALARHSEQDLDRLKGAFGGMSLRMFVLFTLKHVVHHLGVARTRLEAR